MTLTSCPPHWWLVPEQSKDTRITVTATCKKCGETKRLYKYISLTPREMYKRAKKYSFEKRLAAKKSRAGDNDPKSNTLLQKD